MAESRCDGERIASLQRLAIQFSSVAHKNDHSTMRAKISSTITNSRPDVLSQGELPRAISGRIHCHQRAHAIALFQPNQLIADFVPPGFTQTQSIGYQFRRKQTRPQSISFFCFLHTTFNFLFLSRPPLHTIQIHLYLRVFYHNVACLHRRKSGDRKCAAPLAMWKERYRMRFILSDETTSFGRGQR